jgi:hypothetical protein
MKKVIFTLLIQILVTISVAHAQGSVLNLRTTGNYLFAVQIDNQYISAPDRNFTIQNLAPGNHFVTIFRARAGHNLRQVFSGYVNIPFNSAVNAVYERSGRIRIVNVLALAPPVYTYPSQVVYQNVITPICNADFNQLLHTLNNINFDSSRLSVAKQIISNQHLSTDQVIRIMNLFTFDSSKLEFAKYAYGRTVDRNRYFQTYNSFTFNSSVDELSDYIARYS